MNAQIEIEREKIETTNESINKLEGQISVKIQNLEMERTGVENRKQNRWKLNAEIFRSP